MVGFGYKSQNDVGGFHMTIGSLNKRLTLVRPDRRCDLYKPGPEDANRAGFARAEGLSPDLSRTVAMRCECQASRWSVITADRRPRATIEGTD